MNNRGQTRLFEHDSQIGTNVLFVCTGNICRSPAAELLLRNQALSGVTAKSAGTGAVVGHAVSVPMQQLLAADGISSSGFHARQLTPRLVESSDLIVTMTREHRVAVLRDVPSVLHRTFTLLELADLTELAERDGRLPQTRREALLMEVARFRSERQPGRLDDIADPYGRSEDHYLQAYGKISETVRGPITRLLRMLTSQEASLP